MLLVGIFDVVADQCLITALLLLSCQYAKRSFSIFSVETDQSRLCFVFFSHKWREAAYCIAAMEANASSVLLITCTQTRSPLHIGILPLVEQPILFLNEFAYSFSPFASWPPLQFYISLTLSPLLLLFCCTDSFPATTAQLILLSISEPVFVTKYGLTGTYFTGNYWSFGICLMQ